MGYIISIVIGMALSICLLFIGIKIGETLPQEIIEEQVEEKDDFPKTLDGKFLSREAAIKSMSMKEGDN